MNAWKESVKTGQNQLSTSAINLPIPPGPSTWQVRPGWHMLFSHWNNADSRWFNDGSWSTLGKSDSIDLMTTSGHISIKFLIASVHCKVKFATNTFGYVKCVDKWRTNRDFQVAPIKQLEWMRCLLTWSLAFAKALEFVKRDTPETSFNFSIQLRSSYDSSTHTRLSKRSQLKLRLLHLKRVIMIALTLTPTPQAWNKTWLMLEFWPQAHLT